MDGRHRDVSCCTELSLGRCPGPQTTALPFRYTLLCGIPPFQATDGTLEATYDNIRNNRWSFDRGPHPPSPAAQDLLRHMLHPDPFNRASIDSIKRHGFLSDQVPNSLPVSALRVPPARISNSVESEPRVLFVCLEPTWATAENRSRSEAPGRWRLCSSASSMAPAVEPSQGTHQYQVLTDAKIYIMFGRPFVTASCAADW